MSLSLVWPFKEHVAQVGVATCINLITAHTPISEQSSDSVVFRMQPVYFLSTSS